MKKSMLTLFVITFLLTACGPSDADIAAAIAEIEAAKPTKTLVPEPTSTETMVPEPMATETMVPTATTVPPTSTPTPGSGDIIYSTDFSDLNEKWDRYSQNEVTTYEINLISNGLNLIVPEDNDFISFYQKIKYGETDVRIKAEVELIDGTNYTVFTIYCRSGNANEGEYSFSLDTGGYWDISKYDFSDDNYTLLASGGSMSINIAKSQNTMEAVCFGDELSLIINGDLVGAVTDTQFTSGEIGIGVDTWDIPYSKVIIHSLEVSIP